MQVRTQCRRFLTVLACSAVLAGAVAAIEYAPLMPRAAQVLLLDISAAGNRAVVAGARGHILYSDDDGSSWQQAKVPTTQMLTGIYFVDSRHGWAVGHDGIIVVSDDGGENWRIQRDGIAIQQQANIELREEAHQRTREIERTIATADALDRAPLQQQLEDSLMDLEDADLALQEPVFTSPLMDVWFLDQRHGWAVGAFGTLLATADGGQHWKSQSELVDNPDEFHLNTVTGDGTGRVFIAGEGGVMYRSLDSGKTWESLKPVYEGSWFGAIYSEPHNALLVFGLRGNLYRSADFGTTWTSVAGESTISLAGGNAVSDGSLVLVGGVGTVLRSDDGGLTYKHSTMPDRLSLSSAMPIDGRLILVGQGGVQTHEDKDSE